MEVDALRNQRKGRILELDMRAVEVDTGEVCSVAGRVGRYGRTKRLPVRRREPFQHQQHSILEWLDVVYRVPHFGLAVSVLAVPEGEREGWERIVGSLGACFGQRIGARQHRVDDAEEKVERVGTV